MASKKNEYINDIINKLENDISEDVGNMKEDELSSISDTFTSTLTDALKSFNSSAFDDDGFIKKMRDLDIDSKEKDLVKNVLHGVKDDYINADAINQSELLLRRDITNITQQMPEMRDVINVIRDGIVECDVATGGISRNLIFENHESDSESYETQTKKMEDTHKFPRAIKNFIIPKTLESGEMYVHRIPYAKMFAELEMLRDSQDLKFKTSKSNNVMREFKESIPNYIKESFQPSVTLNTDDNIKYIMESVDQYTRMNVSTDAMVEKNNSSYKTTRDFTKESIGAILENIEINNGKSDLMTEYGYQGCKELIQREYKEYRKLLKKETTSETHFMETINSYDNKGATNGGMFNKIDVDDVDFRKYSDIKGVYLRYLDPLKMIPIRLDRRIIGYYYATTTMDLQTTPAQPNGMIDMSFQNYKRDKGMVDRLASLIIKSFDKQMLDKNIKLKNEIAEIIMAHKFSEGKLSFIYIPENEISRFVVNEDENGKGHSVLEPSLFSARNYLMLNMYNMLYTLNNNTTRIHYLRSSGLNKNYAAQIQRTVRKFQSRRIGIDDIYSYQGVLNKIGGMGEMVLPSGRNDYKALETDTIEAVNRPIDIEFLEQQRRQALSGTGVPHLLIINAIDEVDFAKTLEMANTRFLSTISSYKIDFNEQITDMYKFCMKYETDLEDDIINSFKFAFKNAKEKELSITSDMITNFNNLVELAMSIYYRKNEMEDDKGNPTIKQMHLRRELAKEYLHLDFDVLDDIVKRVDLVSTDDELNDKIKDISIEDEDLEVLKK